MSTTVNSLVTSLKNATIVTKTMNGKDSASIATDSESDVTPCESVKGKDIVQTETVKTAMKDSFIIKSPCVYEAASEEILRLLRQDGEMSMEVGVAIIRKYEIAAETARKHFPGAEPSRRVLGIVRNELIKYNILPENTLFAQSICPDEINHTNGGIANVFGEYFGDSFHLGGLAGIPFTGSTGFAAFSHHVPDGGNLFILFAPHIGLSESYQFGQYSRRGQNDDGAACGAAIGAFKHCVACKPIPTNESLGANPFDYQMCYIISEVNKRLETIKNQDTENGKQAELAKQMFEIAREFLDKIVTLEFGSKFSNLILLGGVQINMPGPHFDFFQPLFFEIRHRDRTQNVTTTSPRPSDDVKLDLFPIFNTLSTAEKRSLDYYSAALAK